MLSGLFVPQFTAFNHDNSVDFKATREHGQWLIENNVSGLVPFGTFGEGASLSLREKERITLDLLEIKKDRSLIPTLICNSLGEVAEYLSFAQDLPLDGIMVIPPSYFKNVSNQSLKDFYQRVTDQSSHQIIAYNIPACSLPISAEIASSVPVWGVKDSSGDIESAKRYRNHDVKVLIGSDALLTQALEIGASGGICGIANFFPQQMRQVYDDWNLGKKTEADTLLNSLMSIVAPLLVSVSGFGGAIGTLKTFAKSVIPTHLGDMRLPVETLKPSLSDLDESIRLFKEVIK